MPAAGARCIPPAYPHGPRLSNNFRGSITHPADLLGLAHDLHLFRPRGSATGLVASLCPGRNSTSWITKPISSRQPTSTPKVTNLTWRDNDFLRWHSKIFERSCCDYGTSPRISTWRLLSLAGTSEEATVRLKRKTTQCSFVLVSNPVGRMFLTLHVQLSSFVQHNTRVSFTNW